MAIHCNEPLIFPYKTTDVSKELFPAYFFLVSYVALSPTPNMAERSSETSAEFYSRKLKYDTLMFVTSNAIAQPLWTA
jgi:hypothetical protein